MSHQPLIKVDPEIFERLTTHYVQVYDYTPYTAKICSYLYFDYARQGVTFDQILEYFDISKSTVSNSLHYLMEAKHVSFFYKEDDRKRYFEINKEFVKIRYETICSNLTEEGKIIELMQLHKENLKIANDNLDKRFDIFTQTLSKSICNLQNAIKQLEKVK